MKKWKFYMSLLKERDWLEDMARQGWILKDLTLGMLYHFEPIEPTEKVYEIDRFTVLRKPKKQMLTARKTALDIAGQAGWDVVTYDESMNYYFVKDKAGDESDEFYDDAELRRERAEKYRTYYGSDMLSIQFVSQLVFTIFYMILFILAGGSTAAIRIISWIFILVTLFDVASTAWLFSCSQKMYEELCLSREEWEQRKRFGVKKKFANTTKLLSFLKEKNAQGLVLTDYDNGTCLFEETGNSYIYEIDTKQALKKRLRAEGKRFQGEKKDWHLQSFRWYEMSMAEAARHCLELVCVVDSDTLVYRKQTDNPQEQAVLNPDYNESMGAIQRFFSKGWIILVIMLVIMLIGFAAGYFGADIFFAIVKQ